MTDTPKILLADHLKTLKLPTFLREYEKLGRQCAAEGRDHIQFLARLVELELIDRERRMIERRIKAAKFPATKSLLWLPPVMQEVSDPLGAVIECALLSGLTTRQFQKPRAGMVVSGSGPNLDTELSALGLLLVLPIRIARSFAHSGRRLLTLPCYRR